MEIFQGVVVAVDWKAKQIAARKQLAEFGVPVVFTLDTTVVNPATGETITDGSDSEIVSVGVLEGARAFADLQGTIIKKFESILVAAVDENGTEISPPEASMRCVVGNLEFELAEVDVVRPGGVPILYKAFFTR